MNEWETWPLAKLEELVVNREISYGIVQPGTHTSGGVPIIRVRDINSTTIETSSPLRVEATISDRHRRTILSGGEVLVTIVGSVGECAIAPPSTAGWNVARAIAVLRPENVEAKWLQYCLKYPPVKRQIGVAVNTTVQETLNLADLKVVTVPHPGEKTRQGIISVLGALDDKITANSRANATGIDLADRLYEREVREFTESGSTFQDLAIIGGGGTPSTKIDDYWGGAICWVTPTDVTALPTPFLFSSSRTITEAGLNSCSSSLYPSGSILMTSRATIGAFAIAERSVSVNQGFIVVNARDERLQWWLYHEMRSRVDDFIMHSNGATFLELSRGKFKKFHVRLAPPERIQRFTETVEPIHRMVSALSLESTAIATLRDALLPGLMSGRLRVRDAEKIVEEVV